MGTAVTVCILLPHSPGRIQEETGEILSSVAEQCLMCCVVIKVLLI